MSNPTPAQPTRPTAEEIRKRAAKAIAIKITIAVTVSVVAHVISTAINNKLDDVLFPTETEPETTY